MSGTKISTEAIETIARKFYAKGEELNKIDMSNVSIASIWYEAARILRAEMGKMKMSAYDILAENICDKIKEHFGRHEDVLMTDHLINNLDADDLDLVEILMIIEETFPELPMDAYMEDQVLIVGDIVNIVAKYIGAQLPGESDDTETSDQTTSGRLDMVPNAGS